jgi:hypothetical protein
VCIFLNCLLPPQKNRPTYPGPDAAQVLNIGLGRFSTGVTTFTLRLTAIIKLTWNFLKWVGLRHPILLDFQRTDSESLPSVPTTFSHGEASALAGAMDR